MPLVSIGLRETPWQPLTNSIIIGKDILELLSSSMYVDPMTIYREYIQNAADAIDDARSAGLIEGAGTIAITIDTEQRSIVIKDNGVGVDPAEFVSRMTAFGSSGKRGTTARGFRGVGRLAGIGYCQELIFRSRTGRDLQVCELRWDCRKLKTILRSSDHDDDLTAAVAHVVTMRRVPARDCPPRFFEVELRGIIRHRNDQLLNAAAVRAYLAQVAPAPFCSSFPFGEKILQHLENHVNLGSVRITLSGEQDPICRPHAAELEYAPGKSDAYTDLDLITIPAVDTGIAAVGWVAHHGYLGALPARCGVRGLRLRCGDIQVGDDRLLEELFPEPRFNGWSVGEIHIIDPRIVPNGRRDHFEHSVHFDNMLTHLLPSAREIARRCRTSSVHRKWVRDFELREKSIRERASILQQGALARTDRKHVIEETRAALATLRQLVNKGLLPVDIALALRKRLDKLEREINRVLMTPTAPRALVALPAAKRRVYEHVIGLVYECSPNKAAAQLLVEKILAHLNEPVSRRRS